MGNLGIAEWLIIIVVLIVIRRIVSGISGRSRNARRSTMTPEEQAQYERLMNQLDKQEQRMKNLETITDREGEKASASESTR